MKAIYPGSFDPVTYGHIDIIERAAEKVDHLIVAILENKSKKSMFTTEEKMELLRESTKHIKNIEIDSFNGLLVDYTEKKQCYSMIRGLRAISDYEYEMQMALVNKKLCNKIETFFMVSSNEHAYLSSSIVREVASFGGDISSFVPKCVDEAIKKKIKGGI